MDQIFRTNRQNIFVLFLDLLKVKHTSEFSNRFYNQHPHKANLYGLSKMLTEYGIENAALRIDNKDENIFSLDVPFIAYCGNDFVIVIKITTEKVSFLWKGDDITVTLAEFYELWSGVVLIAEPDEKSIEPNYKKNNQKEIIKSVEMFSLLALASIILVFLFIKNDIFGSLGQALLLFVNMFGVAVGCMLITKQMHVQSAYVDKICSLFKKSDCNNVLESKESRLFGLIGLSEIGLSYFITNMIILLLVPRLLTYLAIINIFSIPFSFWSVWYQKFKVKQWCPLCLIVQGLLFSIFIISMSFGFVLFKEFSIIDLLLTGCLYIMPVLVINLIIPTVANGLRVSEIFYEMNSIKANEDVFNALLVKSPKYNVSKSISKIQFGNPNAKTLITILTNPHCEPCAKMHDRVNLFLSNHGNDFCVQYIFSFFNEALESSNKFLIASYFNKELDDTKMIFNNWFKEGKYKKDDFFAMYDFDLEDQEVIEEFKAHQEWIDETKIANTPTILINGYVLPEKYKVEDLAFLELSIDI